MPLPVVFSPAPPLRRSLQALASCALLATLTPATAADSDDAALRTTALQVFKPLPDTMPGAENDTPPIIALGKSLYFENRLSQNESQSCNTCHMVDGGKAGVDNEPTSPGAFSKRGDRNSPTTWNAGFHMTQFWDGRASNLVEQAKGPVLNPVEMAMPDEATVVARLKAAPEYPPQFKQAFPGEANPITYENMAHAIAAFERTLISRDPFDDFLKGQDNALSAQQKAGLRLFLDVGCTTCHNSATIGANSYQKSGLVNPYEFQKDKGRFDVTQDEDDLYKFKVPSLRNVALTHPYFHDGKVAQLQDVVKRMGMMQLARDLNDEEVANIVAWLNSLSGKELTPAKPATMASAR